jgi:hypothetical protein
VSAFPGQALQGVSSAQSAMQADFRARVLERLKAKQAQDTNAPRIQQNTTKALPSTAPPTEAPSTPVNRLQEASPVLPSSIPQRNSSEESHIATWLQDVQSVAQKTGIIDLRAQDILRAQYTGDSVLADYLV